MARTEIRDLETEGALDSKSMRAVRGGAAAVTVDKNKKTTVGSSKTSGGAVTNDPSAKNSNAHNHQTDGIHDDNNRIGNNGLGAGGNSKAKTTLAGAGSSTAAKADQRSNKDKKADSRSSNSGGASHQKSTLLGGTARTVVAGSQKKTSSVVSRPAYHPLPKRVNWTVNVVLADTAKKPLPKGQTVGSSGTFYESAGSYQHGSVTLNVTKSFALTSGADTKVRDAITFTRKNGVKGYGVELDTAVERNKGFRSSYSGSHSTTGNWMSGNYSSKSQGSWESGVSWVDAGTGKEKWLEGTKGSFSSSSSMSSQLTGKTITTYYDPIMLDLDGDRHLSTTGVGAYKTTSSQYSYSNSSTYETIVGRASNVRTAKGGETVTDWRGNTTTAQAGRRIADGKEAIVTSSSSVTSKTETKRGQKGYIMDFNSDGKKDEAISFATGGDAYLAVDRNHDGLITKGNEMFGPTTNNGIQELRAFDSNRDGKISTADRDYGKLKLVRVELKTFTTTSSYDSKTRRWGTTTVDERGVASSINRNNFQLLDSSYKYAYNSTTRSYSYSQTQTGYVQKVWSLNDEGITSISLSTLAKAAPRFDGHKFGATADDSSRTGMLMDKERDQHGMSNVSVSGWSDQGGTINAGHLNVAFNSAFGNAGAMPKQDDKNKKK